MEFLLLVQLVSSRAPESADVLNKILQSGLRRLKSDADTISPVTDEELKSLWEVYLGHAEIFDAICGNIQRQLQLPESEGDESEVLTRIRQSVQMAHLDALREKSNGGDLDGALSHLRFLHQDYGIDGSEYKMAFQDVIKTACSSTEYGEKWENFRNRMMMMYAEALSSNCIQLVQEIQVMQDKVLHDEIEHHRVSDAYLFPLPLQKFLEAINSEKAVTADDMPPKSMAIKSCMRDLYNYARIFGIHVLECIMDTTLSAVRKEQLEEASDILSLFPLLQPLVAVLGWDLLSGKTTVRRKLMRLLWTSKSQVLRLEEYSLHGKQTDEISCVEYLCDLLCFHLDLAFFVACVNSGKSWNSKASLLFSQKEHVADAKDTDSLDPFVENFVLERLAVQSPLRVLFDVVPGIRFQDAIELISLQPIASTSAAWKRMQDVELMHMRYALESAVLALGAMERCVGDENEYQFHLAMLYLKDLQNHLDGISNAPRKIFMISIITSLLHMDDTSVDSTNVASSQGHSATRELPIPTSSSEGGKKKVVSFAGLLLDILRQNLPTVGHELEQMLNSESVAAGTQALEWRLSKARNFIEDWGWRLSILQRLQPLSERPWSWKEALVILRAAPSKLLNLCMQRAEYDIGEEAVHRFSLPPEDKAALELAEWVAGAFRRASVEDAVSRVAEGSTNAVHELDFSSLRSQLGPLPAILLCIDVAATSARSVDMCKLLMQQARSMLSEIYPGTSPQIGSSYWDQIQEVAIISVTRRVLQRLHDLLEQEKALPVQDIFAEQIYLATEPSRQGQRQRALVILHQMIDDAHQGKRQFLSGKLHNLARALADEDADNSYLKGDGTTNDKRTPWNEKGVVLGLGLKSLRPASINAAASESSSETAGYDMKESGKRLLGPLPSKSSTFLSSFIIYIATIGDIVDGIDTTHDFNFFSLIYEWPKDLLTRLVFERGSTDAAGKVADIMCVDFVHEVLSACVPPVYPPRSGHGWACIPVLSTCRTGLENKAPHGRGSLYGSFSTAPENPLYPLQLDIVKHLAKLSPVRAVLACVFGSNILSTTTTTTVSSASSSSGDAQLVTPDSERLFYEFALDQSERFPTLNRWIQMQSNLHRVSESAIAGKSDVEDSVAQSELKISIKRSREIESDTESEVDDMVLGGHITKTSSDYNTQVHVDMRQDSPKADSLQPDPTVFLSFDWENEGPYEKAVERLISEGKLMDALALSDRCLRNGASDKLLQLLIERREENNTLPGQVPGYGRNFGSSSWQYCLRLKDKQLATRLALKYLTSWELNAAIDVLTMCNCHLSQEDPLRNEVLQMRQALQRYNHILCADDSYESWQEVESDCKEDPEGLALRLAGKGAVSAALEVAESASLSIDLRRELQGRQLVKLLTADPLSGGGPAEASRFLSSLRDSDDALPVAIGAMQLLPDLRSKQLLVHFFLKRRVGNLSDAEVTRLNSWALGLRVLALLPLPSQQRCSALHEHPLLIIEVLLMMKQLQSASLILKEFPLLRDNDLILSYAAKAIAVNVNSPPRESRISVSGSRQKQKSRSSGLSRSNFAQGIGNLQKEARRAFSWGPRDTGNKTAPKDVQRKRKSSGLSPSEKIPWDAMSGIQEERVSLYSADGQERLPFVPIAEEWVLTGDLDKDSTVRSAHKYETAPDITLFKALISLCSDELVSAKGALELCTIQMKNVLSSQHLPLNASIETIGRAYYATETYVQALAYARSQLRKLAGASDLSSNSERSRDADDTSVDTGSSTGSQYPDELSELLSQAELWLGRAELLQSLLGSGIVASLDDIADKESSARLRDRLIEDERYSMAIYTCRKCKVDAFYVWNAWGHALIRMEHYGHARPKFKQAVQLFKGDPASVILEIINTLEGGSPVDLSSIRLMYKDLAESAATIQDDSLSADSYLHILNMPSTYRGRDRFTLDTKSSDKSPSEVDTGPRSNLDKVRYNECIHYLQAYARPQMLTFMFRHGHYAEACLLFFPPNGIPSTPQSLLHGTSSSSTTPRADPLATDYGSIDDLCDLCIGYGSMSVLEEIVSERYASSALQDMTVNQYMVASLARICNYCETHKHFNYLYKFQVIKRDHVAAGLCCIQLFMNSSSQEEAVKHLENSKVHFEEGLSARHKAGDNTKVVQKAVRGKSASDKLTEEELVKFSARVAIQVEVVKSLNDVDGTQWKHSLFGNPSDPETFRRRCEVAETLAEKHFDLAFQVIYQFNLPAVDIYAGVAASLAERKKGSILTDFLRNIKGTIDEDDWDQVLGAAINVYANKHKERPDRLIDMLISSHRKVLACVVCGRLKSAFQIASRSGSVADVQYVAHQALHANALPVLDMCKQWLAQYM